MFLLIVAVYWLLMRGCAHALFGGQIVFDPTMYARQLKQLQQETAEVTNLARQLQYVIKNTTSGGGGVWHSNENLLANLSGIISEAGGLSYAASDLSQQFQQLYPGFQSGTSIVPTSSKQSVDTMLHTLNGILQSVQMQAK
jgi:P-type conjugative transfer protein TrbJ